MGGASRGEKKKTGRKKKNTYNNKHIKPKQDSVGVRSSGVGISQYATGWFYYTNSNNLAADTVADFNFDATKFAIPEGRAFKILRTVACVVAHECPLVAQYTCIDGTSSLPILTTVGQYSFANMQSSSGLDYETDTSKIVVSMHIRAPAAQCNAVHLIKLYVSIGFTL